MHIRSKNIILYKNKICLRMSEGNNLNKKDKNHFVQNLLKKESFMCINEN